MTTSVQITYTDYSSLLYPLFYWCKQFSNMSNSLQGTLFKILINTFF